MTKSQTYDSADHITGTIEEDDELRVMHVGKERLDFSAAKLIDPNKSLSCVHRRREAQQNFSLMKKG